MLHASKIWYHYLLTFYVLYWSTSEITSDIDRSIQAIPHSRDDETRIYRDMFISLISISYGPIW